MVGLRRSSGGDSIVTDINLTIKDERPNVIIADKQPKVLVTAPGPQGPAGGGTGSAQWVFIEDVLTWDWNNAEDDTYYWYVADMGLGTPLDGAHVIYVLDGTQYDLGIISTNYAQPSEIQDMQNIEDDLDQRVTALESEITVSSTAPSDPQINDIWVQV